MPRSKKEPKTQSVEVLLRAVLRFDIVVETPEDALAIARQEAKARAIDGMTAECLDHNVEIIGVSNIDLWRKLEE